MNRVLLRRTLLLAVVLIPVGAMVGFRYGHRQYRSVGIVRIVPVTSRILFDTGDNGQIPMYDQYIDAEAARMRSSHIVNDAMSDPAWRRWKANFSDIIANELTVIPQNEMLIVTVWNADPEIATTAVGSIIRAYVRSYNEQNMTDEQGRMTALNDRRVNEQSQVDSYSTQILEFVAANAYGTDDLEHVLNAKSDELIALQDQLFKLQPQAGDSSPTVNHTRMEIEARKAELTEISRTKMKLDDLKAKKARAQAELQETTNRIDAIQTENDWSENGRLSIISEGDPAITSNDIRDTHPVTAAIGGGAGLLASALLASIMFAFRRAA